MSTINYEEMGKQWLDGDIEIGSWEKLTFSEKQQEFINAKDRFVMLSGGFAAGKTSAFIVKLILLAIWFPNNRILLGRKHRQYVEQATLPDFFDLCPEGLYEYKSGPGIIHFPHNGSQILLYGLDALQGGTGHEIKKAEQAIKSLNLGAVFIDQAEEIEHHVFEVLDGRLRRDVGFQQMNLTTNPANYWGYDVFKKNPIKNSRLVETTMLDNRANLPDAFVESQLNKPDRYKRLYVYGEWSEDTILQGTVFYEEQIKDQQFHIKNPVRSFDNINIFEEPEMNQEYQIGVDPSEGSEDPCSIIVVSKTTGAQVASYSAYIPIHAVAEKAVQIAMLYSTDKKPLIIPEANMGAIIEALKDRYDNIYERETFQYRTKEYTKKLGFFTNHSTKRLLIENLHELFNARFVKIRDNDILDEFRHFVYTNEAQKKGAGAQSGKHDDRVIALMLAYWNVEPMMAREAKLRKSLYSNKKKANKEYSYV